MKTKFNGILTLLLALVVQISFAQDRIISGIVSDETGPLPGVSILKKGTTLGTETDFDGKYSIKAKTGDILVFSFLGMKSIDKAISSSNTINITLQGDTNILDEIIVTGQGAGIGRKRLSTTVDVISSKDIEKTPTKQLDQLLQASAPGAQIKLSSGQPGTSSIIRTRGPITANGNTTPVIIVDGIRVDNLNSNSELGIATGGANSSSIADIPLESI
ncbi:TonB-dependent receptor-like protein [Tenacibaculum adriaticum]|uniref:TonB-dependent receptor-like protein n=1 Tax=Tenacibaculum adriaticum TaxID=413713 RepID=A0A5S5DQ61_9FLAO|nr:carboxypeptidase-like regulatory domain-containing protein [Tenacibaculum adriaticum]TYP98031.1 TonB-dependent receptor-like protein [Tenacibaculum adriaticum]